MTRAGAEDYSRPLGDPPDASLRPDVSPVSGLPGNISGREEAGGSGESLREEKSDSSGEAEAPGWGGDPEVPSFTGLTFYIQDGRGEMLPSPFVFSSSGRLPVRGNAGRRGKSCREFGGKHGNGKN